MSKKPTTTEHDLEPTERRRRARYEAQRTRNAERIATNAARTAAAEERAKREGRGQELAGCALCGIADPEASHKPGRPGAAVRNFEATPNPGNFGQPRGYRGRLCAPCAVAWERAGQASTPGDWHAVTGAWIPGRPTDALAVAARLDAERSDYRPAELDLERRHLPTLTWAGFTFAAWGRGEEAPEPTEKPFGWLPAKWGRIAFPPAPTEPEPPKPTPKPRTITDACGICGDTPRPSATVTAREARAWGLDNRGGNVATVFCGPCAGAVAQPITGYGTPLGIAAAVTRRLATEQPAYFKRLGPGLRTGYLAPAELVGKGRRPARTWATLVIDFREAGEPDPEPRSGQPFWWLAPKPAKPKPTPDAPRFAALEQYLADHRRNGKT